MIASACLMTILWLRGTPGLAPKQTADYPAPPVAPLLQSSPSTDDVDSQLSAWRAALNASLAARSVGLLPSAGSVIPPTTTFPPVAPTPPAPQAPIAEAAQLRLHSSAVPSSDAVSASDLFPKLRPARAVPALECPGPRCRVASPQSPSRRARPPAVPAAANLREDSREATKSTPAAALPTSSSGATSEKRRVVFVKTYKTGSTTVAMFLNAVAYQLRLRALHPEEKGWFAIGELKRRARAAIAAGGASPPSATTNGAYFDVSFRHLSPHTEYEPLQQLLPGCLVVSILREPLSRFVSLFNFVGSVRATHKTAEKLVAAVNARNGLISDGDANAFCNNMAWVVRSRINSRLFVVLICKLMRRNVISNTIISHLSTFTLVSARILSSPNLIRSAGDRCRRATPGRTSTAGHQQWQKRGRNCAARSRRKARSCS